MRARNGRPVAIALLGLVEHVLVGCNTLEGLGRGVVSTAEGLGRGVVHVGEGIEADLSTVGQADAELPDDKKASEETDGADAPADADDIESDGC